MKKGLFIFFIVVCAVQLFVPAKMAWEKETVITEGNEYRFRTAPIDPYDPFRGKYITLSFDASRYQMKTDSTWKPGEKVYVYLGKDEKGFAKIEKISKDKSTSDTRDFVISTIRYVSMDQLTIDYGFDQFYMAESKSEKAEIKYREAARDTGQVAYASVYVKDGDGVIKDVIINGVSIVELAGEK